MRKKSIWVAWQDWEVERLREMWLAGEAMGAIMVELPGRSKNSIVGKADRLSLPPHDLMVARRPPVGKLPLEELDTIRLKKSYRRALEALLKHPQGISYRRLADHLYVDDPNDGPNNLRAGVKSVLVGLERHIRPLGWRVGTVNKSGLRLLPVNPVENVQRTTNTVDRPSTTVDWAGPEAF